MTERQRRFCDEYLIDLNATQAAELLGKRYGLFADRVELNADTELHVTIDYGDEE